MNRPRLVAGDNGVFSVHYWDGSHSKRVSLRTTDSVEANKRFGALLLQNFKRDHYTVAQAWQLREAETLEDKAAPQRIRDCWKRLLPHFGATMVPDVTAGMVRSYIENRTEEDDVTLSTVRRELVELRATLQYLVDTRRMASDKLPLIVLPPESEARPEYLTEEQIAALWAAARKRRQDPAIPTRLELWLHLALRTGQRKKAIETLEWSQIDFANRMIHFAKKGERITKKRKASMPIHEELEPVLLAEKERAETAYVLRHPGGVRDAFDAVREELKWENVTPHTMRHTFISHLLMKQKPIYSVAQLVGLSVRRIEETYGHLSKEHLVSVLH